MKFPEENILLPFYANVLKAAFGSVNCTDLLKDAGSGIHISYLTRNCDDRGKYLRRLLEDDAAFKSKYFRQELDNYINRFLDSFPSGNPDIFDVIFEFSKKVIIRSDHKFCYKYELTEIWRDYSRYVDEEIITTAAALMDRMDRGLNHPQLDFSYCINCDSKEILNLLKRDDGTSENHFHLRGSSPYFSISWIYLMNHIDMPEFERGISKMETEPLAEDKTYVNPGLLIRLWRKAAAIRLYLYCICRKENGENLIGWLSGSYDGSYSKNKDFSDALIKYIFDTGAFDTKMPWIQEKIESCYNFIGSTPRNVEMFRQGDMGDEVRFIDYAQLGRSVSSFVDSKYFAFRGERQFLCDALAITRKKGSELFKNLFYIYLIIKHIFHRELVQSNERIGFFNFREYQSRKDYFVPLTYPAEYAIAADTISSIADDIKINKVELRITPSDNAAEMWRMIHTYDAAIKKALLSGKYKDVRITDFFYTLHFSKSAERDLRENVCRNFKARARAMKQAKAIVELLFYDPSTEIDNELSENSERFSLPISERIRGIDACAEEMDCRPEVFGVVYRFLQWYYPTEIKHQIKATYHVAEDNYDIVDALRAIDEAILFCELRSGSRLGHATLLGINAGKYYHEKNSRIFLPEQNWLDNVVWLYFFIKEESITFDGCALLLDYLNSEFTNSFHRIFWPEASPERLKQHFGKEFPQPDINEYFLSWLLRGDEPGLYETGALDSSYLIYDRYLICDFTDKIRTARKSELSCYLYYLYHFRADIKQRGAITVMKTLPEYFIEGTILAQKSMIRYIASLDIGVETNPTSNLYISSIKSYGEHPISEFYKPIYLNGTREPQLNISINTDDKSVFSTSLSNEYTFLLHCLEHEKEENGEPRYSRRDLLRWLDEIRKMGNEQSFAY